MWVMYSLKTTIVSKCEMDETLKKWVFGAAAADTIVSLYLLALQTETDEQWRCCCGSLNSRGMCGSGGHVMRCEMLESRSEQWRKNSCNICSESGFITAWGQSPWAERGWLLTYIWGSRKKGSFQRDFFFFLVDSIPSAEPNVGLELMT